MVLNQGNKLKKQLGILGAALAVVLLGLMNPVNAAEMWENDAQPPVAASEVVGNVDSRMPPIIFVRDQTTPGFYQVCVSLKSLRSNVCVPASGGLKVNDDNVRADFVLRDLGTGNAEFYALFQDALKSEFKVTQCDVSDSCKDNQCAYVASCQRQQ